MNKLLLTIVTSVLLSACGSGSDDNSPSKPSTGPVVDPQPNQNIVKTGIYLGTTAKNQEVRGLLADDNSLWFLYQEQGLDQIGGLITGGSVDKTGVFNTSAKDYNILTNTVYNAQISGEASVDKINGEINYGRNDSVSYNLSWQQVSAQPSLNSNRFIGRVAISGLGVEGATIIISDGNFNGQGESGCRISGSLTDSQDKTFKKINIKFGNSPCTYENQTFTGVAYYKDRQLLVGATNSSQDIMLISDMVLAN